MVEKRYRYSSESDEVLLQRSIDLRTALPDRTQKKITLISFHAGGMRFAVESHAVMEVITLGSGRKSREQHSRPTQEQRESAFQSVAIIPIPLSPSFIPGMINVRGMLVTLVDLAQMLLDKPTVQTKASCILHLQSEGADLCVLTEDQAETIVSSREEILQSSDTFPHHLQGIISGAIPDGASFIGVIDTLQFFQYDTLTALLDK